MTLKHTPGPWKDAADGRVYSAGEIIADATFGCLDGSATIANARLISAAPDLLAALQYVTDILSSSVAPDDYEPFRKCVSQARAAISKATGE
jgi:hypothetical protein